MYRLSRSIRSLKPTRSIQTSRRLATDSGDFVTPITEWVESTTRSRSEEYSKHLSLKKEDRPSPIAEPLERRKLNQVAKVLPYSLIRIDYVPSGTTGEELRESLSKYGDVHRVEFGTSAVDQFFGRAYAMFSTHSERKKLALSEVHFPADITETIFVLNIDPENTTKEEMVAAFSKYGLIQDVLISRTRQTYFAHIVFDSLQAAQLAIHSAIIDPIRLHDKTLVVSPARDPPRRVLCISGFLGGVDDVRSLFKESEDHIEDIRLVPSKSRDGTKTVWIGFPTIRQAVEARANAFKSHPSITVIYAKPERAPELPSPKGRPPLTRPTGAFVALNPSLVPSVLLVSNVPNAVTTEELQAFFGQHAPGGVASVITTRRNPHVLPKSMRDAQKEEHNALVSLCEPDDVARVLEAHKASPFSLSDAPLEVSKAFLDQLEPLSRTVKLDDVVDDRLSPLTKMALWEKMGVYGKVQNIRAGRTPGSVFVKYEAQADAFNAIVRLSQNPLVFQGHKARPNFGPSHLRTDEEYRHRMQKIRRVPEDSRAV